MGAMMETLRLFVTIAVVALFSGCARLTSYHLDAFNATGGAVDHAKIVFDNGKRFEWGVMNSNIEKGMWPMPGPLGHSATVEWEDTGKTQHVQQVQLPRGKIWNAIRFVLQKDGSVLAETQWK
jgi:hypothetical protein